MKLINPEYEREDRLFYVDDIIYYKPEDKEYRVVESFGHVAKAVPLYKYSFKDDVVGYFIFNDKDVTFIRKSTKPFNEIFFKGDKTMYYDEYSNRFEVKRFEDDEDNKELAILYAIAKSKRISAKDIENLYIEYIKDYKQIK